MAGGDDPDHGARLRLNLGMLPDELVPTSTIEISPDGRGGWRVIAAYAAHRVASTRPQQPDPVPVEGIDAGVSEVFTTTDGRRFGAGQYERVAARAERDRARGKARHKLRDVRARHLAAQRPLPKQVMLPRPGQLAPRRRVSNATTWATPS